MVFALDHAACRAFDVGLELDGLPLGEVVGCLCALHGLGDARHHLGLAGLTGAVHGALAFALGLDGGLGLVGGRVRLGLGCALCGFFLHRVLCGGLVIAGVDVGQLRSGV